MDGLSTLALVVALAAPADSHGSWYVTGSVGRSIAPFLGSEDKRSVWTLGVAYSQEFRRLRIRSLEADLVLEGYYQRSTSPGIPGVTYIPPIKTDAYGILASARYHFSRSVFFDIGWGLQYATEASYDLPSRVNSTPTFMLGTVINPGEHELLLGLRFMHISNAGFVGNNPGQNQVSLWAGYRF